ncbi:rubrerythrin family protein [Streptomyces laurentii]|jgi:rubrerythrin|uniref:Rubrerythrin n=1 Tax=Streptomyces laurentii TaxID=39478 RepID=A0A160NUH4_STRLU|nr:rubrerythrin [Streptomyces laurentii]
MAQLSEGLAIGLRSVFAAEAASVQRYTYFAQVAEIEGHGEIARLFSDLAESIGCVAHGHIDALQDIADPHTRKTVGETRLNLAASAAEALTEANEVYPRLTARAHEEGHPDVASWLTTLAALKHAHLGKLDALLTTVTTPSAPGPRDGAPADGGSDD